MKFTDYLLGPTAPALFGAAIFFAAIGVFIVLLLGTNARNKNSDLTSPKGFSWSYLWSDNTKRLIASSLCVLATLRFMPEILNIELTTFNAFCVGMGWDVIIFIIKQKTNILDPKKTKEEN